MKNIKVPKKLSQAIMMAVNDLSLVERDSRYLVNMKDWHMPADDGRTKCEVCFAGSIMAKSLNTPTKTHVAPFDFRKEWKKVFYALNAVREGKIASALQYFYSYPGDGYINYYGFQDGFDSNCLKYEYNPVEFKNAMIDVAAMLESNGY